MSTKSNRSSGTQHNARGVTQGNTLVDPYSGLPIDVIVDSEGKRRLAVDAKITAQIGELVVELDYNNDSVQIGDPNTGFTLKINPDGSIDSNVEIDAADGDNVAISSHPLQISAENADIITTANFEEIFSYTSSSGNTRINVVECTVSTASEVRLLLNGVVKRVLRTSSLERNAVFRFDEHMAVPNGQSVTVEARVDRLILNQYETFVSLQGYRTA